MLRIECSFFPGQNMNMSRNFLTKDGRSFCILAAEILKLEVMETSLLTRVVSGADQRYSYKMAELNFDLYHNPPIVTHTGADELLDRLSLFYSELQTINVRLTYLVGISHSMRNDVHRFTLP